MVVGHEFSINDCIPLCFSTPQDYYHNHYCEGNSNETDECEGCRYCSSVVPESMMIFSNRIRSFEFHDTYCVDELPEDDIEVAEGSAVDSTAVDVGEPSTPTSNVVLGVTSAIGENEVVVEEGNVETTDDVEIDVVGVLMSIRILAHK